jgi:ribosomal protein S18 acetylase RimI-like enzyme
MITMRRMQNSEIERIAEIDRSEHVTKAYVYKDGSLEPKEVDWQIPQWSMEGDHDHTIQAIIDASRLALDRGGVLMGAFNIDLLVGFAIYLPNLSKDTAQLAMLHISNGYRRQGTGSLFTNEVTELANADGAKKLYVSSSPSVSTVHFYMKHGFELAQEVNPELYELEPEDIHMTKIL